MTDDEFELMRQEFLRFIVVFFDTMSRIQQSTQFDPEEEKYHLKLDMLGVESIIRNIAFGCIQKDTLTYQEDFLEQIERLNDWVEYYRRLVIDENE